MLIKIKDQLYDSDTDVIVLMLTASEKSQIKNMDAKTSVFLTAPQGSQTKDLKPHFDQFMTLALATDKVQKAQPRLVKNNPDKEG